MADQYSPNKINSVGHCRARRSKGAFVNCLGKTPAIKSHPQKVLKWNCKAGTSAKQISTTKYKTVKHQLEKWEEQPAKC